MLLGHVTLLDFLDIVLLGLLAVRRVPRHGAKKMLQILTIFIFRAGLMMSNRGDLVKCDPSIDKGQLVRPKLKTPQRAIEKILRAYHGDPSYLLDLCRRDSPQLPVRVEKESI
jgi:hypothetical protein